MGLFSRKKDAEGFYTGDAPVSAPGIDGQAPSAYISPGYVRPADGSPGYVGSASPAPADPGAAWGEPSSSYLPDGASPGMASPPPAGPPIVAEAFAAATAAKLQQLIGQDRPAPHAAGSLDPETAARVQKALAGMTGRSRRLGCVLLTVPLLAAAVGIGGAIYAAISATGIVGDGIPGVTTGHAVAPDAGDIGVSALGAPVSIRTADAAYDVVVFGAQTQTGGGWGYDSAGGDAVLVVDAQITRTDSGTHPVRFIGWNWSVTGADGDRVMGSIISHFLPSLDGPELIGGQSARGYVTFDTAASTASLAVAGGPAGEALATWRVTASTPDVVDGAVGAPARAELSRPGFTVTVGRPSIVPSGDARIGYRPQAGQYLVVPVEFAKVAGADGHLGAVAAERFVFAPDGAAELLPTFGGVDDAFSFVSIDAAAPEAGFLAFDTTATSGRLELRDQAGRPVITWQIG